MKKLRCILAAAVLISISTFQALAAPAPAEGGSAERSFRPPAIPLVTHNPYLSVWSEADKLTDDVTRHWTHREHPLVSLIRIDGKTSRLMGNEPKALAAFPQMGVRVLPTRSIYEFDDGHVHLTLTFLSSALPDDLDALAQPLSYLTWQVRAVDGAAHAVSLFDSTSALLTVNAPAQKVQWARESMGGLTALRAGTVDQPLFTPAGDDTRIDWGFTYVAAPTDGSKAAIGASADLLAKFADSGELPARDDAGPPRAAKDNEPSLAFAFDLGKVGAEAVSRHLIVAYDEIYSIKYFGQKLRPYWRRNGATPADMLQGAERNYTKLVGRCEAFDNELMADLTKAGGARYAQIAALAYRQCVAGCGLAADSKGQPLFFTKENTSNGDIATVDVIFPMDPIWVALSPTLAKASLVPILSYAASDHWKFPNAPHDLGTYPVARGTDDGGEGMPVEESGNMLILLDAIAQAEGNPDFVAPWWPQLTQWAKYLERYGLDPEEQLCTDDFMGHLAHNSNLSIKAILGLAAYGDLCHRRGDEANAKKYFDLAKKDAEHWMKAADDDGHSRLAFDKSKTWSQKYNLVWDRILGLNVFPPSVAKQEVAYYRKVMLPFGVPLDSRTHLTKTDWSLWSATLADNQADFEAIVSPIYDYLNTTSARSPLVDSYVTDDIKSDGMHARPVVGGIFVKMLADRQLWEKWAARDKAKVGGWALLPQSPKIVDVVPSSQFHPAIWRYTTQKPQGNWQEPAFDASAWQEGNGGFGTPGTPGAVIGTIWKTDDIWLRRDFTMPEGDWKDLQLIVYHDEDVEVYINGVLAVTEGGYSNAYEPMEILKPAKALLKPGAKITLAAHCHQTTGGQGVDVGIIDVVERQP
jgi:hypothetical protein